MATSARRQHDRVRHARRRGYGDTYVQDNTVRRVEAIPEQEKRIQESQRRRRRRQQEAIAIDTARNREKALHVNASYVAFMVVVCVALIAVSVSYLQLQAAGTAYRNTIASMESQLSDLRLSNDYAYEHTMAEIDMEKVKEIAIGELGMHYAEEGQIITYNSQKGDYIRQYGEITRD